jgi:hypothetical protein
MVKVEQRHRDAAAAYWSSRIGYREDLPFAKVKMEWFARGAADSEARTVERVAAWLESFSVQVETTISDVRLPAGRSRMANDIMAELAAALRSGEWESE